MQWISGVARTESPEIAGGPSRRSPKSRALLGLATLLVCGCAEGVDGSEINQFLLNAQGTPNANLDADAAVATVADSSIAPVDAGTSDLVPEPGTDTSEPGTVPMDMTGAVVDSGAPGTSEPADTGAGQQDSCSDMIQNGDESDVDCGGSTCPGCADEAACLVPADCASMACTNGFCGDCGELGDADGDGVRDCDDECPMDEDKSAPGDCGCGVVDTPGDADGDGTLDCNDACPNDDTTDVLPCAGGTATEPDTECTQATHDGRDYFFCRNDSTWDDARTKCQNVAGGDLATIADEAENTFIANNVSAESWVGATDDAVENEWRWLGGVLFSRGSSAEAGAYVNWAGSEPNNSGGNEDCLLIRGGSEWNDEPCSNTKDFVCEVNGI